MTAAMSVYALLDRSARRWWYFRRLREHGQHAEARAKERESVRHDVAMIRKALRDGGHCTIGATGSVSITAHNQSLSGAGISLAMACINAGLLTIDCQTADFAALARVSISGPMCAVGEEPDAAPYHALSYAPRDVWLAGYATAGCRIWNDPREECQP